MNSQQRDVSRLLEQNDVILARLQDRRRLIESKIAKHLAVKRELEQLIAGSECQNGGG